MSDNLERVVTESIRQSVVAKALAINEDGIIGDKLIERTTSASNLPAEIVSEVLLEFQSFHPTLQLFKPVTSQSHEQRMAKIYEYNFSFIDNPCFHLPGAAERFTAQPAFFGSSEKDTFLSYNFLKKTAGELRDSLGRDTPNLNTLAQIESIIKYCGRIQNYFVTAMEEQVLVSAYKRVTHLVGADEQISAANEAVMRAIDKYDVERDGTFEKYASVAIKNSLIDLFRRSGKNSSLHFVANETLTRMTNNLPRSEPGLSEEGYENLKTLLSEPMNRLDIDQAQALRLRFGLDPFEREHTLAEIGTILHLSRYRVESLIDRGLQAITPQVNLNFTSFDDLGLNINPKKLSFRRSVG